MSFLLLAQTFIGIGKYQKILLKSYQSFIVSGQCAKFIGKFVNVSPSCLKCQHKSAYLEFCEFTFKYGSRLYFSNNTIDYGICIKSGNHKHIQQFKKYKSINILRTMQKMHEVRQGYLQTNHNNYIKHQKHTSVNESHTLSEHKYGHLIT